MSADIKDEFEIPACGGKLFSAARGDVVRVIASEGPQGVDLIAFNRRDLKESLCIWLTRQFAQSFTRAEQFYSKLPAGNLMFTSLTDKPGMLWLSPGRCNAKAYEYIGHPGHVNCQDTLAACIEELGLGPFDVPEVLNIFMTGAFRPDGSYDYRAADIEPGDSYDLRAEMDVTIAVSNCPDDLHDYNQFNPKPIVIQIVTG